MNALPNEACDFVAAAFLAAEIGPYKFKPGNISRALMDAYSNAVRLPAKAA